MGSKVQSQSWFQPKEVSREVHPDDSSHERLYSDVPFFVSRILVGESHQAGADGLAQPDFTLHPRSVSLNC
ncbi:MAG: hypothetical protein Nkreftii_001651 [Candidatus Nitrospira kreftii]|uniref:Uncharacterized protein n=1 Tax=Candidatus Nitrospira kreftii TaxID=2652173 RepID=A0A7S8FDM9_9BACT|nr:MAG: hypothetical protein Nkreftii_001651 [Candidatus Nitrospira kreftii]